MSISNQTGRSIRAQLMWLSLIIITVSVALLLAGTPHITLRTKRKTLDQSLSNSAFILSQVPLMREALLGEVPADELADFLGAATARTSDVDLILVEDAESVLRYASDRSSIGSRYAGSAQTNTLARAEPYTSDDSGPVDSDHSAYVPIRDESEAVIGFMAVGLHLRSLARVTLATAPRPAAIGVLAATVGALLALRLSRYIKCSLMGYELDASARRLHRREDILETLKEEILTVDRKGRTIFLNAVAAQVLSLALEAVTDRSLHSVYPPFTLDRILRTGRPEYNVSMRSLRDIWVLAGCLPLYGNGALAGTVGIFRNRTGMARLADDLTDVRHMVDAMRAYTHEFMNKLYAILGLSQIDELEWARQYIMDATHTQQEAVSRTISQIEEPSVVALLVGKTSRTNELDIRLMLDRENVLGTETSQLFLDTQVTILGNLIENATKDLNQTRRRTKEVPISIREGAGNLFFCVESTGSGIPSILRRTLFEHGASSKGRSWGTGLVLVREVMKAYHGDIRVESETDVGVSFFLSFYREPLPVLKEEPRMYRVVIMKDDPMVSLLNRTFVEQDAHFQAVQSFQNGRAALAWPEQNPADPAVLDVHMPPLTRLGPFHAFRGQGAGIDAIMVTVANGASTVDTLLRLGMMSYLAKPFTYEWFQRTLDNFCRHQNAVAGDAMEQSALDRFFSPVPPAERQSPKDLQESTLRLVRACLWVVSPQGLFSEALSCQTGLSVVAVWRYANYLVKRGEAVSAVNCDTGDHPCRLYHYPGPSAWTLSPSMARASVRNVRTIGLFRLRSPSPKQEGKVQTPESGSR